MAASEIPCLSLAIAPLKTPGHFGVHVTHAPYPGGYQLNECRWSEHLSSLWQSWQDFFSTRSVPFVPHVSQVNAPLPEEVVSIDLSSTTDPPTSRTGRSMQDLGMSLWRWLFDGPVMMSLNHSQGIAMGQRSPLRLRLEIRDPNLIALPWEIMQDGAGRQSVSLSQDLLFSRTTSDVATLPSLRVDRILKILLVLGEDADPGSRDSSFRQPSNLSLKEEAAALAHILRSAGNPKNIGAANAPQVDTLVEPTSEELTQALETRQYNVLFYAGHGAPAPDGGMLFLGPNRTLNGTELAQVLTRCQVKLAVFNACWGAQPDLDGDPTPGSTASQAMPRSSLLEVLIHHGVPAVLGMRDSITDEEARSFIQAFAKALAERLPIDQAVAVARQHLVTLYRFNQQAWTLPVLYMHPQFDGELLKPIEQHLTQIPSITRIGGDSQLPVASVRSLHTAKVWPIRGGIMRVGRDVNENDLVLQEEHGGISRKHAVIFCRQTANGMEKTTYFLEDFSTFGTWVLVQGRWQKVHREEFPLPSGAQLKFGSTQNEVLEFVVDAG